MTNGQLALLITAIEALALSNVQRGDFERAESIKATFSNLRGLMQGEDKILLSCSD